MKRKRPAHRARRPKSLERDVELAPATRRSKRARDQETLADDQRRAAWVLIADLQNFINGNLPVPEYLAEILSSVAQHQVEERDAQSLSIGLARLAAAAAAASNDAAGELLLERIVCSAADERALYDAADRWLAEPEHKKAALLAIRVALGHRRVEGEAPALTEERRRVRIYNALAAESAAAVQADRNLSRSRVAELVMHTAFDSDRAKD